ncbi:SDR family NAD(P)-dependent oxidoreductase [Streptomyces purpurascens]|uniref:SDR family oxidoreductase n=1 Tax=Streptomyces purpurascens TaxID=1924 RepID=A0ABZ1MQN4_STREF|nr:SDR family oxidoreductase [Streptomyces purpurascens]MCE7045528.1 SDR family oxidoreductase [Streptomyces purpurascens]GHA07116.1 epimerase [Streptomyces purpurascens]
MTRRCALVTGGSRGIGAAIATELAADGHRVAVHCRADSAAAKAVLDALPGTGHALVTGDVGTPGGARGIIESAVAQLGTVDVLVNNAGIYAEQPVATTSYEDWQADWRRVVDVNLLGPADLIWHLVDHLRQRPQGPRGARIVNVGSRGAYRGEPDAPAYGATKAALHSLTQSLAQSLGPLGVAVTAVAPGFVRTDLAESMLVGDAEEQVRRQSPLGRIAAPSDVAAAVAWLSGERAEWCSGAVIDVNGASHLR